MAYQYPQFNLGDMFLAAQRMRGNQLAIEERERQRALAPKLAAARRSALAGDFSELAALAPQEARQWTQDIQQAEQRRSALDMAREKQRQAVWKRKMELLAQVAPVASANQNAVPAIQQRLLKSGFFNEPEVAVLNDPTKVQQLVEIAPRLAGMPMPEQKPVGVDPLTKTIAGMVARVTGDAEAFDPRIALQKYPGQMQEQADILRQSELTSRKAGAPKMVQYAGGRGPEGQKTIAPTKSTMNKLQDDYIQGAKMAPGFARLRARNKPYMFTLGGAVKTKVFRGLAYLNPDWVPTSMAEEETAKTALLTDAEKQMLAFRKLMTGVAGGEKEMAAIAATMPNKDDNWFDFNAKLNLAIEEMATRTRLVQKIMAKGIPLDDPAFEFQMATYIAEGEMGRSRKDIARAAAKLREQYKDEDEVLMRLAALDYISEKQFNAMRRKRGLQ